MASDPIYIVGNCMEAKACHVTSSAECGWRYGPNKNTKMVSDILMASDVVTNFQTNCLMIFNKVKYLVHQGSHHRNRHNCHNSTWHASGSLDWSFGTPSDDTTTTQSTMTVATPAEEPPPTLAQQHNHAASLQPTAVTQEQKWFEDDVAMRLPVESLEGYALPLAIDSGLAYFHPIHPPTHTHLDSYPNVVSTSPQEWDPSVLDHGITPELLEDINTSSDDFLFDDPFSHEFGEMNQQVVMALDSFLDMAPTTTFLAWRYS